MSSICSKVQSGGAIKSWIRSLSIGFDAKSSTGCAQCALKFRNIHESGNFDGSKLSPVWYGDLNAAHRGRSDKFDPFELFDWELSKTGRRPSLLRVEGRDLDRGTPLFFRVSDADNRLRWAAVFLFLNPSIGRSSSNLSNCQSWGWCCQVGRAIHIQQPRRSILRVKRDFCVLPNMARGLHGLLIRHKMWIVIGGTPCVWTN